MITAPATNSLPGTAALLARQLDRRGRRLRRIGKVLVIAGGIGIFAALPLGVFGVLGAGLTVMAGRLLVEAADYLAVRASCHAVRAKAAASQREDKPAASARTMRAYAFNQMLHELAPPPRVTRGCRPASAPSGSAASLISMATAQTPAELHWATR
ncbi:MAG TPA: hypothetical protein VG406_14440 [Isosphaeraceae bacterium]|jgi:hypothetical protein|nr:hypothetical protein [Isosphaeraceae bacterium]